MEDLHIMEGTRVYLDRGCIRATQSTRNLLQTGKLVGCSWALIEGQDTMKHRTCQKYILHAHPVSQAVLD